MQWMRADRTAWGTKGPAGVFDATGTGVAAGFSRLCVRPKADATGTTHSCLNSDDVNSTLMPPLTVVPAPF